MAKKKAAAKKAAPKPKSVKGKATAPKKAAAKTAPKKGARVWESKRGADRAAAAKATTKAPAQVPLIRGLRIPSLDKDCRLIADTRAAIARLQAEEKDLERIAHEDMKKHRQTSWQSAGVTLVRVPGEERLRVTTSRSGSSTSPAEETTAPATPIADEDPQLDQAAGELEDSIVDDVDNQPEGEGQD